jgi:hypothetical protein
MLRVKDKADSYAIDIPGWFSITPRILVIGKSQYAGKTTVILNAMLRDTMFGPYYEGKNIYIFSESIATDEKLRKLIDFKNIPTSPNQISMIDEEIMSELYDKLEEDYLASIEAKEVPPRVMLIFDDISASGGLKKKKNGMINKFTCQGRHIGVGFMMSAQKLSDLPTGVRENATGVVAFEASQRQMDLLATDHSFFPKRASFFKLFNSVIREPRDFLIINYSAKNKNERFMDKDLKVIDWHQFL